MALMPASQATAWVLILQCWQGRRDLLQTAAALSIFYGLWAVKNRLTTIKAERGYSPMFMTALGCIYAQQNGNKHLAMGGAMMVILTFLIASTKVLGWPASKLAHVSKKTKAWAYVTKAYYASSIASWSVIAYLLYQSL